MAVRAPEIIVFRNLRSITENHAARSYPDKTRGADGFHEPEQLRAVFFLKNCREEVCDGKPMRIALAILIVMEMITDLLSRG